MPRKRQLKGMVTAPRAETTRRIRSVRQVNTAPELAVRGILSGFGVRYRVDVKSLPGRPDIVNQLRKWALFVHGCFWHGHEGCRLATRPRVNPEFWNSKIDGNRLRDTQVIKRLQDEGFRVLVVWQCEIRDEVALRKRLRSFLADCGYARMSDGAT